MKQTSLEEHHIVKLEVTEFFSSVFGVCDLHSA